MYIKQYSHTCKYMGQTHQKFYTSFISCNKTPINVNKDVIQMSKKNNFIYTNDLRF